MNPLPAGLGPVAAGWVVHQWPAQGPLWQDGHGVPALHRLRAERAARVARTLPLLHRVAPGLDLAAAMTAADPRPFVQALERLMDGLWQPTAQRRWVASDAWFQPVWPPEAARAFTLVTDLGLLLGERAIACEPARWCWGLDDFDGRAADGQGGQGALVVRDPSTPATAVDPPLAAPIGAAYGRYLRHAVIQAAGTPALPPLMDSLRRLLWDSHRSLFDPPP